MASTEQSQAPPTKPMDSGPKAVSAGRGVLYIAVAKLYFMVAGYAIYFTLPRLLGSEAAWGDYLLVVGLASVIDNVIVTGTIQGVSKFTAQGDVSADAVKRAGLQVQLLLGGGVALAFFALAPLVARWEQDASLTGYYRIASGIVFCYALYAVFVGSANGQRHFGKQASLDMGFATMRAAAILGGAAAGYGVFGAIGGFVAAAAVILVVSALWVGLPRGAERLPPSRLAGFMVRLFVYTLALNATMRVDLFLLKRYAVELSGLTGAAAARAASAVAGHYGTAQSLAFIPYQAILAVAFVIFPLVSRSTFDQDLEATQAYIRQTLRLSLVFSAAVATVFIANPEAVIVVPYPATYVVGAPALRILAGGMVFFSMFTIINTILNGAGRTRDTIISGVATVGTSVVGNMVAVPRAASAADALVRAAWASSGAMALGMLLATGLLMHRFRAAFPPLTVVRTLCAAAAMVALGSFWPDGSKLMTLIESVALFFGFFVVMTLLGEFRRADLATFARSLRRGR
jgi:stage V sporulation protein B